MIDYPFRFNFLEPLALYHIIYMVHFYEFSWTKLSYNLIRHEDHLYFKLFRKWNTSFSAGPTKSEIFEQKSIWRNSEIIISTFIQKYSRWNSINLLFVLLFTVTNIVINDWFSPLLSNRLLLLLLLLPPLRLRQIHRLNHVVARPTRAWVIRMSHQLWFIANIWNNLLLLYSRRTPTFSTKFI